MRRLRPDDGNDTPMLLLQGLVVREEGRRVPIGADAQHDEVQACRQTVGVLVGGDLQIGAIHRHAVHPIPGQGGANEQRITSEAEVALRIVGGDRSLVCEEDVQLAPRKRRGGTQGLVDRAGRGATRESDGKRTGVSQPPELPREEAGGDSGEAVIWNDQETRLVQVPPSPAVATGAPVAPRSAWTARASSSASYG